MENFKFIYSNNHDPYFNLASEEYLLKQTNGYYIYLWVNEPSVIIGSNQNALLEVNLSKANEKGIKVVRRLSGGGAVYHDLNNLCYTIIAPYNKEENNYIKFTSPVINYLNDLGVNAKFSGRNDVCINDKKISGNAQVVYKDRIMHHGTILFDTNLNVLGEILIQNKIKVESKGIKSIRARVCNVKEFLPNTSFNDFVNGLVKTFKSSYESYDFTQSDIERINRLITDKYSTYEWNIGSSPKGSNRIDVKLNSGVMTLTFDLLHGVISNAEIFGDFLSTKNVSELANNLNGKKFTKEDFTTSFLGVENYLNGTSLNEIINKIF